MNHAPIRQLSPDELTQVPGLLTAAQAVDGVRALSEQAELQLHHPRDSVLHLGESDVKGRLVGYAQVDVSVLPASVEGVVHPEHRGRGLGTLLRDAVLQVAGRGGSLVWAHGAHPGARALAASSQARLMRALWMMRRPLGPSAAEGLGPVELPDGVRLRAFEPGRDEAAFLRVNAAAFRGHPEQGHWRRSDLEQRTAEPWFDPSGFLLAEDEATGELLGFHWTKVHPPGPTEPSTGEVYVVGVHPGAQGRRLGGALTRAGLHHLASVRDPDGAPLAAVVLYVEADNEPALRVYRSLGFELASVDEQYALEPTGAAAAIVKV